MRSHPQLYTYFFNQKLLTKSVVFPYIYYRGKYVVKKYQQKCQTLSFIMTYRSNAFCFMFCVNKTTFRDNSEMLFYFCWNVLVGVGT